MNPAIASLILALLSAVPAEAAILNGSGGLIEKPSQRDNAGSWNSLFSAPDYQSQESSCPLLPNCPEGPSFPLPPVFQSVEPTKKDEPIPQLNNLAEGFGKYKGMLLIPAGPFEMGSSDATGRPDEKPRHTVYIGDFYISKHEVTNAEFCSFLNRHGEISSDGLPSINITDENSPIIKLNGRFQPKAGFADNPVTHVSWFGAYDYAQWAGGRLPTSAQWEKAAAYSSIGASRDNIVLSAEEQSSPVYTSDAGAFGIAGMLGGIWEWCSDWYGKDYYGSSPPHNPLGPSLGQEKIIRGGSWASAISSRRIPNIHRAEPRGYYRTVGLRLVKD